jgi:hypothetical protein
MRHVTRCSRALVIPLVLPLTTPLAHPQKATFLVSASFQNVTRREIFERLSEFIHSLF